MDIYDLDRSKYTFIEADNENFQYSGRVDFSDKKAPTMIYAGSSIRTKFEGTSLQIVIKNKHSCYENFIGYIIDGNIHGKISIPNNNEQVVLKIMDGLKKQVHDLVIYKRQDACHYFKFYGLVIDKNNKLIKPEERKKRRIECFGDSISAGEISEAVEYVGKKDPENHNGKFSNAWFSYAMMTARNLNAEINNNAQGGLAVLNKTGYFRGEDYLGLEFTYDKLRYNPELGECTKWDFSKYIPHVVIMALGQNDANPVNYINSDMKKRHIWKEKYKDIIKDLRNKYPKALFVLITTILEHNEGWDNAIDEIQEELDDPKVVRYRFIRNGCGTPGHVRIPEAEEMANELTSFINSFDKTIWE